MPDIITHYIFGMDLLGRLDNSVFKSHIENNKALFFIGNQGPDPFLYHDFISIKGKNLGAKTGNLLHEKKTGVFFIKCLNYIKNTKHDDDDYKKVFSFITGFICHFALDKNAHPYICYKTGNYNRNASDTYKYRGNHKKLETAIDTILLKEKLNLDSRYFKINEKILSLNKIPDSILNLFDIALKELYNIDNGYELFKSSYKDFKNAFSILYDPNGIKKIIFYMLDKTVNKKGKNVFSNLSYYKNTSKNIDYMNKNKSTWLHPCDKNEKYNLSFYELYETALNDAIYLIQNTIKYLNDNLEEHKLKDIFKDISYSTGKSTKLECDMKYFDIIF